MAARKTTKNEKTIDGFCHCCYQYKPHSDFYKTKDHYSFSEKVPFCKECVLKIFNNFMTKTKKLDSAIYYTCAKLDLPFIKEVYEGMVQITSTQKSPNYFGNYVSQLELRRKKGDTWNTFINSDVTPSEITTINARKESLENQVDELKNIWGRNFDFDDINFLEYRFTMYTDGLKLSVSQEKLYRDLCILELQQRKLVESNSPTKEIQKQIMDIMSILKIDKFKEEREKGVGERMLETWIGIEEQTDPADYYKDKEKFADFCNIGKDYGNIMRSLKNLLTGSREYPDIN